MNYILYLLLVALIALNAVLAVTLFRTIACSISNSKAIANPDLLSYILQNMVHTVEKDGDWKKLEIMRADVRGALRNLDKLRHDVSKKSLRDSKPSRTQVFPTNDTNFT